MLGVAAHKRPDAGRYMLKERSMDYSSRTQFRRRIASIQSQSLTLNMNPKLPFSLSNRYDHHAELLQNCRFGVHSKPGTSATIDVRTSVVTRPLCFRTAACNLYRRLARQLIGVWI